MVQFMVTIAKSQSHNAKYYSTGNAYQSPKTETIEHYTADRNL